jgi:hypothetical protein
MRGREISVERRRYKNIGEEKADEKETEKSIR